jgi:type I restriction enzyme S subunit
LLTLLKAYKERFTSRGAGGAQPNISREKIIETVIPLPPLEEQKRIVAKVDELMALCDKLEDVQTRNLQTHDDLLKALLAALVQATDAAGVQAAWQQMLPHFDTLFTTEDSIEQLKQTILQLAVMGRLVAQNPDDEPASKLLQKIAAEKKKLIEEGKIKKEKPLPAITEKEKPFALPNGWEWVRLGEAITYGNPQKVEARDVNEDTWILELEDIERTSSKLLCKIRYANRPFKSTKSIFSKGDVIYGKLRPYLDKVIIADEDGVCTTEMIPIKTHSGCSAQYLRWYLKTQFFIFYADNSTHGMNLPRLGTDKALNALFSLPPLEEQKRIVAKVDEMFTICDALKERITAAEALKNHLSATIIQQAAP